LKRREYAAEVIPEGDPHHDGYDDGTHDELWRVVEALPPKARAVVVLRYYEQMSAVEVADALGIPVGTVKSQCNRALSALRERVPAKFHPRHREEDR
jgi:RNA polymerase sigma factor (sigma-70 family)